MYNKYNDLEFSVLEDNIPVEGLTPKEIFYINKLKPLCNIAIPNGDDSWTYTEDRNRKVSVGNLGKKKSAEHALHISEARKGMKLSYPVWNKGNGEYMSGEKNSFYGKHHTLEDRKRISETKSKSKVDIKKLIQFRNSGMSYAAVGRVLGVSRTFVNRKYKLWTEK